MAAVGQPDLGAKLQQGLEVGGTSYKVHLDGYDQRPLLSGSGDDPRREFFYWTDDGDLAGLRYERWKLVFMEQRSEGFDVWQDPMVVLRLPKLFDLRSDPFELADHEAIGYARWRIDRVFLLFPAQAYVARYLGTFRDFPPRQAPGSFSLDQVTAKMKAAAGANQ